jgi:hypothetical protein
MLVCTRLKAKFDTYASFYISVNEEDFPFINNTGVWQNGCLIVPFYGKLTTNQVFPSSAPLNSVTAVASSVVAMSPNTKLSLLFKIIYLNFFKIGLILVSMVFENLIPQQPIWLLISILSCLRLALKDRLILYILI